MGRLRDPSIRRQNHPKGIVGWDDPFREARPWIVPAKSSRLESYANAEGFEAACGSEITLESSCFQYQPIHAHGAVASHSTGTLHAPSSLNGTSHPAVSLESLGHPKCIVGWDDPLVDSFLEFIVFAQSG
jgi:hypothetical protein